MNNALLVTVLNGVDDLPEFVPRIWLSQSTIPSDHVCTAIFTGFFRVATSQTDKIPRRFPGFSIYTDPIVIV